MSPAPDTPGRPAFFGRPDGYPLPVDRRDALDRTLSSGHVMADLA
ncbi:hypothetical protein [Tabrizicola piscis]|nr:hypothetical protein [Tabrizicola piscis]